ncbi:MAG: paraquat-inducible protein A [Desulfobacterales bacterium]|nr:paraquat-inducible protein A [Desulfobacterales bacterium]
MSTNSLIACHECDLLHRVKPLTHGSVAQCMRCGAVLYRQKKDSLNRTLSLTIAGLILFVVANTHPFLALKSGGLVQQTTLITGIKELYAQGMEALALLVLFTSILAPLVHLVGMLYVLLPLKFNRLPRNLPGVFRLVQSLQPWSMMEVFMLGILVSVVKLAKMGEIVPGMALYSFLVLIFVLAASTASLDPHLIWKRWKQRK